MEHVRVVSINIWNRWGPWPERCQVLRAGLAAESPDVVALQEVLAMSAGGFSQLREVGDAIYPHGAYGPAWTLDASTGFTMGNGVLTRFPILDQEVLLLPNPREHETRSLLLVLLETPHGQLPVLVTHLDWQLDLSHVRCQQVAFIVDKLEGWVQRARQRPGADVLPAVLAGDFNAEPDSDEIRFLRGRHALPCGPGGALRGTYFNDCYAYCGGDERSGVTFSRSNPYAATEREPERRLDYIFVALPDRQLRGEPLAAWRTLDKPTGRIFPSDHYGVAADIQIRPRTK